MDIQDEKLNILLAKYFSNEASTTEEQEVYAWIESSEDHLRYFEGYMRVWDNAKLMPQLDTDENKAWNRFKEGYIQKPVKHIQPIRKPVWLRAAAVIIALVAGAWLTFTLFPRNPATVSVHLAAKGLTQIDTLPDRSVVTLNKHAILSYTESPDLNQRTVTLQGEAFFDVAPDKKKPFVIMAGTATIKVVGTSFNVKTSGDITEVIVNSGTVQVSRGEETVELTAGEKIAVGLEALEKTVQQDMLYHYYVTKTFICDNTPLWKLVEKLNEAYGVNIVIENKDLSNMPISVTFNEESLDTILAVLRDTLMISIVKQEDTITIK